MARHPACAVDLGWRTGQRPWCGADADLMSHLEREQDLLFVRHSSRLLPAFETYTGVAHVFTYLSPGGAAPQERGRSRRHRSPTHDAGGAPVLEANKVCFCWWCSLP